MIMSWTVSYFVILGLTFLGNRCGAQVLTLKVVPVDAGLGKTQHLVTLISRLFRFGKSTIMR